MNSIIQTGQLGLNQSYQRMTEAAHNIAMSPVSPATPAVPGSLEAASGVQGASVAPATNTAQADKSQAVQSATSIEESVLELRRQQQVFNASASVVSVGQELVGTLLDDYS